MFKSSNDVFAWLKANIGARIFMVARTTKMKSSHLNDVLFAFCVNLAFETARANAKEGSKVNYTICDFTRKALKAKTFISLITHSKDSKATNEFRRSVITSQSRRLINVVLNSDAGDNLTPEQRKDLRSVTLADEHLLELIRLACRDCLKHEGRIKDAVWRTNKAGRMIAGRPIVVKKAAAAKA